MMNHSQSSHSSIQIQESQKPGSEVKKKITIILLIPEIYQLPPIIPTVGDT